MGYGARFTLKVDKGKKELRRIMEENPSFEGLKYAIEEDGSSTDEKVKWYTHEKDMKELSLKYPEMLFTLKGEGESSGDIWIQYFKNGKSQLCEAIITFDPYDESKLE